MIKQRPDAEREAWRRAARAAYYSFNDERVVAHYFREAKNHVFDNDRELLKHLQLKYYHAPDKWTHLNGMADIYERQQRYYLVHMCLAESLRQRPQQEEVYQRLQRVKSRIVIPRLEMYPEDRCAVSVIMTTYQFRPEIRESIESVLQQAFTDYELVLVNDGGPRDVEKIIEEIGSDKIRYLRLEKNRGLAGARNEGLKLARGHYITYLDDDDVFYPHHLQVLFDAVRSSGREIAYSSTQAVEGTLEDGRFRRSRLLFKWDEDFDRNTLVTRIYITTCSILHERSLLNRVSMFQEDMRNTQDWDLWLRFALKASFCHVKEVTSEYRIREDNQTIQNRVGAHFLGELVCRYHGFRQGEVSAVKALIARGDETEARQRYEALKRAFDEGFQAGFVLDEFEALAEHFGEYGFACRLCRDFFRKDTRACLRSIIHRKSCVELGAVLPLLPGKIMRGIGLRYRALSVKGKQ